MHYIKQHIFTVLDNYAGDTPLSVFLKGYFKNHPRLGSRDRKSISEAVYGFYRLSLFYPGMSREERLLTGLKTGYIQHPFLSHLFEVNVKEGEKEDLKNKLNNALQQFIPLFALSDGLEEQTWTTMLLKQRSLFIRIRKHAGQIKQNLTAADYAFKEILPQSRQARAQNCLVLPNNLPLEKLLEPDTYVIQDHSVQTTLLKIADFSLSFFNGRETGTLWDTCAGAGGKSLYWKDLFPEYKVLATDRRSSILYNLRQRARLYKSEHIHTRVLDMTRIQQVHAIQQDFDLIICDVPCSGSGTWGRTPEQFYFADQKKIMSFPELQYRIVSQALPRLKAGGLLCYITCSAFNAENEAVVRRIEETGDLKLLHQELIYDSHLKADIIYLAVFTTS